MLILPPVTLSFFSQDLNPDLLTATLCSPAGSSMTEGVLPAKLPSTSISAPVGSDATDNLAIEALAGSAAAAVTGFSCGAEVAADAALIAVPCLLQSLAMASQASWTEPPRESVDLLTMESPLTRLNTATLFLWRRKPLPPSWSKTTM